ncbi:MAG: hypothetical protein ABIP19_15065 [Dermatophilaceae bacterium]
MKRSSIAYFGATTVALVAAAALGAGPALAHSPASSKADKGDKTVTLKANLQSLNNSGATGHVTAKVRGQKILSIKVSAKGLTPDAPHAQHIHYGNQALNECPTFKQDTNRDNRINTVEGVPAYGPVVVSLNTTGDTSPASLLAVTRFPVAKDGMYSYSRKNINITSVAGTGYPGPGGTGTAKQIAESIREGEGVVVIHGIDYDQSGAYSLSKEGASELDPNLPAEATDPAACGVLR